MLRKTVYCLIFLFLCVQGCDRNEQSIAVIKFATHPALDEFENGFVSYIESAKKIHPELFDLNIEQYNAGGSRQMAKQLAEIASRSDVRLIVAIATPAAQAVSRTPTNIPLLYGAVADPEGSGIIPSERATGIQNAGPNIIEKAISVIHSIFPDAKRIGTIYNPGEQNSVYVQKLIKQFCESKQLELIQSTVNDATQLSSITEDLLARVDLIYSANDNTVNAGVATVVAVCNAKRKPFIIGDLSTLSKGPAIAIGLEYKTMGIQLAHIAEKVLLGGKISDFPPQGPPEPKVWLNKKTFSKLGLSLTADVVSQVDSLLSYD